MTRMGASRGTGKVRGSRGDISTQAGATFQHRPGRHFNVKKLAPVMGMSLDFARSLRPNTYPLLDVPITGAKFSGRPGIKFEVARGAQAMGMSFDLREACDQIRTHC